MCWSNHRFVFGVFFLNSYFSCIRKTHLPTSYCLMAYWESNNGSGKWLISHNRICSRMVWRFPLSLLCFQARRYLYNYNKRQNCCLHTHDYDCADSPLLYNPRPTLIMRRKQPYVLLSCMWLSIVLTVHISYFTHATSASSYITLSFLSITEMKLKYMSTKPS